MHPPLRENFRHIMEYGLREYGVPLLGRLIKDSVLVDLGYVAGEQLRAAHERYTMGTSPVDLLLFPFLATELGLRALTQ
ncbi:hypothetical protein [Streptoalloteichus hindustanus]|uniref:Uncharacterized protein n=1 Tax=Streptoalloteichus hindustanus TaxID=2017 RepID=A0A1M5F0D5_STRHI|nr:hypothetical protein [Streptoalloteichus hindustanus]SHF85000.1 hypothetical protein SAMN05444320_105222 [Streptoalloteichus hindustanus]